MKKLFKYLKPYSIYAIVSPLMMMGEVLCDLILPRFMTVIVDCGIKQSGVADVSNNKLAQFVMRLLYGEGPYEAIKLIITFGILMLLVVIIGGVFGISCAYTAAKASQGLGKDLRCDAYKKVMSLSLEQTDKFTTGSLVTRMTNDISMIIEFFEMLLRMVVRAPMFFIGGAIMLITLNLTFGAVLLCTLPVLLAVILFVLVKAAPMYSKVQNRLDRVNAIVQENVSGARVVKAYVRKDYECERFEEANRGLRDTNMRVLRLMAILMPIINIVVNLAIVAILYIGGFEIQNDPASGMTTGSIMAAITYVTQILMSIMMVTMIFQSISRAMASAKRVTEVLESDPVIVGGGYDGNGEGDIAVSFRHVGFSYPESSNGAVLKDITFDIKKGETFAIIGATGSGKSTLVNLIPRFYDATEGDILIDGIPIKDYDTKKLRRKIGFVMQKSELFSDTVANNISWGKASASRKEIEDAAKTAQADEFVKGFTGGYDSFIAEKGASLSGGQKQRLSIARALVRKPEILILDDSTSALDLATEAKLHRELKEKIKDSTVIMIAQRIASVRDADRIAVIEEDGRIINCAPHDELMKISETYREIYNSQMKNGGEANE